MTPRTDPRDFPRRILLSASGLSPQVVTETLYALAVRAAPGELPFIPTEIHLVTTGKGCEQARLNLLSEQRGWFHRLRSDYGLPAIAFDASHIHALTDAQGQVLTDIRTPEDNEHSANCITELMRELTSDDDAALHVSIAGGRKTMGFYLGYALSLFARPQDRLSHVLVAPEYESLPDFYYPTPYEHILHTRGPKAMALDARRAEVQLAEIPFVSLRQGMQRVADQHISFRDAVISAQRALAPPSLVLRTKTNTLVAGGVEVELTRTEFSLMAAFAWRALQGQGGMRAPHKEIRDDEWTREFRRLLEQALGMDLHVSVEEHLEKFGVDGNYFSSHKSRLQDKLKKKLGPAADAYRLDKFNGSKRLFGLALPPDRIRFE